MEYLNKLLTFDNLNAFEYILSTLMYSLIINVFMFIIRGIIKSIKAIFK